MDLLSVAGGTRGIGGTHVGMATPGQHQVNNLQLNHIVHPPHVTLWKKV